MSTKLVPGQLIAVADTAEATQKAAVKMAEAIREAITARGHANIALSGGNTPRDAYKLLATEVGIDWTKVDVYFVDERAVQPTDDRSNYRWTKATLIDGAKIPEANVHRMPGESADLTKAAADYAELIDKKVPKEKGRPAFDLMLLGIGDDGHTASLFPDMDCVAIMDAWATAVPKTEKYEPRITLTTPVIENARVAIALVSGAAKHEPLEKVWEVAGAARDTPARILRNVRGHLIWIIDRAAGGL